MPAGSACWERLPRTPLRIPPLVTRVSWILRLRRTTTGWPPPHGRCTQSSASSTIWCEPTGASPSGTRGTAPVPRSVLRRRQRQRASRSPPATTASCALSSANALPPIPRSNHSWWRLRSRRLRKRARALPLPGRTPRSNSPCSSRRQLAHCPGTWCICARNDLGAARLAAGAARCGRGSHRLRAVRPAPHPLRPPGRPCSRIRLAARQQR